MFFLDALSIQVSNETDIIPGPVRLCVPWHLHFSYEKTCVFKAFCVSPSRRGEEDLPIGNDVLSVNRELYPGEDIQSIFLTGAYYRMQLFIHQTGFFDFVLLFISLLVLIRS